MGDIPLMNPVPRIIRGDCLDVMTKMPSESVDLVITSPPYADARAHTYGGVHPEAYNDWFLPRAAQIKRILKPDGSFVLNIKEKTHKGERVTYVIELILALKHEIGFCWVEEYVWTKSNAMCAQWVDRFKDAWERLLHFTKRPYTFKMNQEAVMIPGADFERGTLRNKRYNHYDRVWSGTGSGRNWIRAKLDNREWVLPSNVIHGATSYTRGHSAAFPPYIPEFFIKCFTDEGDTVLDPFSGSGTTCKVAERLGRQGIGIEILEDPR